MVWMRLRGQLHYSFYVDLIAGSEPISASGPGPGHFTSPLLARVQIVETGDHETQSDTLSALSRLSALRPSPALYPANMSVPVVETQPSDIKAASRSSVAVNNAPAGKASDGLTETVPRDEEVRMLRKFDTMLLPPLALMSVQIPRSHLHKAD